MVIAYKVVRIDRKSFNRGVFGIPKFMVLDYPKNQIVHAAAGSVGIFCFKTKAHAESFILKMCRFTPLSNYLQLLEVEGIGDAVDIDYYIGLRSLPKGQRELQKISQSLLTKNTNLRDLRRKHASKVFCSTPPGTVCFKAVKVLS